MSPSRGDRRVVVVTGGGGGIGAAIATELGRQGCFVVTVDPLVTSDGSEPLPPAEETTAGRIVAAGGAARASSVSVTDGEAVHDLFQELVDEHGRLDAVVNVAGITRPTTFARGTEEDWREVLAVHLGGYLNVLGAALPIMAAAGHGRVLGVTSGSGWRAADAGAYGCAKRAVAALTWQLGREAPAGVAVNAVSPIAVTRMVTEALARAAGAKGSTATGGLALGSMPEPEQLGPLGAHLVGDDLSFRGQVLFAAGSEVAVVDRPRLLEVVATEWTSSLPHLFEAATVGALGPAEARQASTGGANPRFPSAFAAPTEDLPPAAVRTCAVVAEHPPMGAAVTTALEARGVACTSLPAGAGGSVDVGSFDAVAVVTAGGARSAKGGWTGVLAEHAGLVEEIATDGAWARAVAGAGRPMRLVTLVDARTAGGRSRAQAAAQLSRAARRATDDRVAAFAVSVEGAGPVEYGELAAHLLCSPSTPALSGAELVAAPGWCGLRGHPRPAGSIALAGPDLPPWFDAVLGSIVEGCA
ncbi:MAG TPA: SDR family NAD(P)-dependent oxidoreductase [Iamia sp.]